MPGTSQSIFYEERNYHFLLRILQDLLPELEVTLLAYCLLPNHYHWLVRQDGTVPAGQLPQRAFNRYVKAFNKTYGRRGTLFQDRYSAKLVDTDAYLRQLCLYIHANPVSHGLAIAPELWPFSNYQEWIGRRPGTLNDHVFVRTMFGSKAEYAALVKAYLTGQMAIPEAIRSLIAELP